MFSLFVGNLHGGVDPFSLKNYFSRAGDVRDVHIPRNQKSEYRRYGFVSFGSLLEANAVVNRCNGDFVWGRFITVQPALRERNVALNSSFKQHSNGQVQSHTHPQANTIFGQYQPPKAKEKRSYCEALRGTEDNPTMNEKKIHNLEYTASPEDLHWLARSAVAHLHDPVEIDQLETKLKALGVHPCSVKPMGGDMVLLTFQNEDSMRRLVGQYKDILEDWFSFIKPWEAKDINQGRFVWLKCTRIPLHAWNANFFKLIGTLPGKYIAVDEGTRKKSRLDVAKILVLTNLKEEINRRINIAVNGDVFEILVSEDYSMSFPDHKCKGLFGSMESLGRLKGKGIQASSGEKDVTLVQNSDSYSNLNHNGLADKETLLHGGPSHRTLDLGSQPELNTSMQPALHGDSHQQPVGEGFEEVVEMGGNTNSNSDSQTHNQNLKLNVGAPEQVRVISVQANEIGLGCTEAHSISSGSTQFIPETPLDCSSPKSGLNSKTQFAVLQAVEAEEGEQDAPTIHGEVNLPIIVDLCAYEEPSKRTTNQEVDDVISADEDYAISLESFQWQDRRHKGVEKRKARYTYKRKCKALIHMASHDKSPLGSHRLNPESCASQNKIDKIHKTVDSAWNLGKLIGLTHSGGDEGAKNLLEGIEHRNWDDFERQQNE